MRLLTKKERELREKMRGRYAADAKWYAVMVYCGRERRIRDRILTDFVEDGVEEVLLPELLADRERSTRERRSRRLLFQSYVFLNCRMNDTTYMTIIGYDDVFSILGRAFRIPTIIDDSEMTHLKGVLTSYPLPKLGHRRGIGAEAIVTRGLMEGMRGRVIEYNSRYIKLETGFSFFDNGTSVIVSVPSADVSFEDAGMRLSAHSPAGTVGRRC